MKLFLRTTWFGAILGFIFFLGYQAGSFTSAGGVKVFYSLDARQNDREIVRLVDDANRYAYFAVYTFTKENIADALVRAKRRGVEVEGITDLGQSRISEEAAVLEKLRGAGIQVVTQKHQDGIMHIKALVTDKAYAIGSYNWTWSATNINDEVLEIGTDESLRGRYLAVVRKVLDMNR